MLYSLYKSNLFIGFDNNPVEQYEMLLQDVNIFKKCYSYIYSNFLKVSLTAVVSNNFKSFHITKLRKIWI